MTQEVVLGQVDRRGVATVTLNRPEVNNAYNGEVIQGLQQRFDEIAATPGVRAVVIRGNDRHFQAGADLKWIDRVRESSPEENLQVSRRTAQAMRGLNEFPCPTVALVQGGCFGGGIGLIASCDVVIAERSAIFAITEARWGLHASIIVPQLNAAMGVRQVRRYALSCERFGAERACELGLVHEVCDEGGLDAAAHPVIEALLSAEPDAMARTKRHALHDAGLLLSDEDWEALTRDHAASRQRAEAAEGLASFREKRMPQWFPPEQEVGGKG
jgi:methylglutaconyl-CoA hydratase